MEFEHQEERLGEEEEEEAAAPLPPPHDLGLRPPSYDSETAQPNPSSRTLYKMNSNKDDDDSPSPIATVPSPTPGTISGKKARARYRECLKNHAVGIGGQAVDGCGEFMAAGPEGSLDGLKCAACNCHRNFHRKELEVPRNQTTQQQEAVLYQYPVLVPQSQHPHYNHPNNASAPHQNPHLYQFYPHDHRTGTAAPPGSRGYHHLEFGGGRPPPALPSVSGGGGGTGAQSRGGEDEEDVSNQETPGGTVGGGGAIRGGSSGGGGYTTVGPSSKKRFRTKFSQEQKDKMLELAEQLGWKIQKQDEGLIQSFCEETGVKRQVLKVWMHNNKLTLGKKKALN